MADIVACDELTIARTAQMRALRQPERLAAIEAAGNVVGFDRFLRQAKQVELSRQYKCSFKGKRR